MLGTVLAAGDMNGECLKHLLSGNVGKGGLGTGAAAKDDPRNPRMSQQSLDPAVWLERRGRARFLRWLLFHRNFLSSLETGEAFLPRRD